MKKLKIFLSHSSRDKEFVNRLNKDLKSGGFSTWIDDVDIPFAESIAERIQRGLKESDILFLFLSNASVKSRWVATEWQSQFFRQISEGKTIVVPVLIEACDIPEFLKGRKYIDFTKSSEYTNKLAETLEFLQLKKVERFGQKPAMFDRRLGIRSHVVEILSDLEKEVIQLPQIRRIPIVGTLKKIERSGKVLRLTGFKPEVRVRSVYDHIISLAHISDCFLPSIDDKLTSSDLRDLSLLIAYHDINEVILGDIPAYTSLSRSKRASIRVYAEQRLKTVPPEELERIANDFVWLYLSEQHRQAFRAVIEISQDKNSKIFKIFKAMDKIDPIVSVWRYLHHYRGKLGPEPKYFNTKMKDFYENPDVAGYFKDFEIDTKLVDTLAFLQDRTNAWDYYIDKDFLLNTSGDFLSIPSERLRSAIEDVPLFSD
ncbi:TIR domain-containing protein [Roseobacter litoralis]|uniref:TIR domain-containing protein n=1 Tax=Roseobacter litoralis TaxID=42443 RepID=UPI0024946CCB|nr:TIR domain-containing protein [Roseobacter litoralis]